MRLLPIPILALCLAAAPAGAQQNNTLTAAEKKAGWRLLFDGESFKNWQKTRDSWAIEDGTLTTKLKPKIQEDLITRKSYGDFQMEFDWRVSEGGRTGVKYRLQRTISLDPSIDLGAKRSFESLVQHELDDPDGAWGQVYTVAFEMQLIDDERHPDAKKSADRMTGALYSMLAPAKHPAHPAGQWNHAKLQVRGTRFEHWINGELVLSGSLDDPAGLANLKKRWVEGPGVYDLLAHPKPSGQITLRHDGDKVWFRNLKIREPHEGLWDF
jgi:hypothetical protein